MISRNYPRFVLVSFRSHPSVFSWRAYRKLRRRAVRFPPFPDVPWPPYRRFVFPSSRLRNQPLYVSCPLCVFDTPARRPCCVYTLREVPPPFLREKTLFLPSSIVHSLSSFPPPFLLSFSFLFLPSLVSLLPIASSSPFSFHLESLAGIKFRSTDLQRSLLLLLGTNSSVGRWFNVSLSRSLALRIISNFVSLENQDSSIRASRIIYPNSDSLAGIRPSKK